jgi:hypothetical protein
MTGRQSQARGKVAEQHGRQLLVSLGHEVIKFSTTRRRGDYPGTMQTPGVPDYGIWLKPIRGLGLRWAWWESKAGRGVLSPAQRKFQVNCERAGILYVVGDLDALIAWQVVLGYLRPDQVAHYHLN